MEQRTVVTPVTPCNRNGVTAKPAPRLACTLVTPVTPEICDTANEEQTEFATVEQQAAIRAWLAHIEETDPDTIAEVMDKCRVDPETLAYFTWRADEVPQPC